MPECGAFAGETGDSFLGKLYLDGVPASEAVRRYADLDIIKAAKVPRRYEIALDLQRSRDHKSDIDFSFADYIDQNLSKKTLFLSRQSLATPLLWKLAEPVFARLLDVIGEDQDQLRSAKLLHHLEAAGLNRVPIHPRIVEHFNLPGIGADHLYAINRTRLSFNQYSADYVNEIYQYEIYAGLRFLADREFRAAVESLKAGFELAPGSPDAADGLSRAYAALGRNNEALEMACVAVHRDVENRAYMMNLAQCYLRVGHSMAARAALERSVQIHPDHLDTVFLLSDQMAAHGHSAQSVRLLETTARRLKHVPAAYHKLAYRLCEVNEAARAADVLTEAMETCARHLPIRFQLADVLVQLRRENEAVPILTTATERHADSAECHFRLGHVLWRANRLDEAEAEIRRAENLAPQSDETKATLADLLAARGRANEGVEILKEIVARQPDNSRYCGQLGYLLWRGNHLADAACAFARAVSLAPENRTFKLALAEVLTRCNKLEEALPLLLSAAENSGDPDLYTRAGRHCLQLGDLDGAESWFTQAIAVRADYQPAIDGVTEITSRKRQ